MEALRGASFRKGFLMADDSIAYWTDRLAKATTPQEYQRCKEYLQHYEEFEVMQARFAAKYPRNAQGNMTRREPPPLTAQQVLWFPYYAASIVLQGAVLSLGWLIFAFVVYVLIASSMLQLWQGYVTQFAWIWRHV